MPITNVAQITRMATLSGAEVPAWVVEAVTAVDDPADVRRVGVDLASRCAPSCSPAARPACTSTR